MARNRPSWFAMPNVSWAWAAVAGVVWALVLMVGFRSELGYYLESRVAQPLDFRVRDALGMSPALAPELKVYAFDDSTFEQVGGPTLSLDQWVDVLRKVAANEPKIIFIDQIFSTRTEVASADAGKAIQALKDLKVPLVVGSFVTPAPIRIRQTLPLDRPEYALSSYLAAGPQGEIPEDRLPMLADGSQLFAYGPTPELLQVFKHVGHINYRSSGSIEPLLRMSKDVVLGHMTIFLADERRIEDGKLLLDGVTVPVNGEGRLVVNFPNPKELQHRAKTLRSLLDLVEDDKPSRRVKKGDVVLIIPQMFTGAADFRYTPFGYAPGGLVISAMLNSILTRQWLRPLVGAEALVLAMVTAGVVLGVTSTAIVFWSGLVLLVFGLLLLSQYLFAFHGIVVPWLFPLTGLIGSALTVFAEKTRVGDRKVQALRTALTGSVAEGDLKVALRHPERVTLEARERVVTLMFIDVVGFSLLAENMLPRMAFDNLKKMLALMSETIHEFGGIIDKTLGDGLLCYFGYRFDLDAATPDHAEKALRCAIKIQRDNLMRNIEASENGEPVYPLRIGINTSSCYLGDLGTSNRIDFTVVGNGVNFAKRLEGACDMHSVLMGGTTFDLVRGIGLPEAAISKRFVRIKHHSELVEAFEYDPFNQEPDLRAVALDAFRKCANIERVDQRWPVHDPTKIQLFCDFGEGRLVNFSHTGISIRLKQLLAKGTRLTVTLDAAGGALKGLMAKDGIALLHGEVRWGYPDGPEFVHGVMLTGISEEQSDVLVQYLCEFAFSRGEPGGHKAS